MTITKKSQKNSDYQLFSAVIIIILISAGVYLNCLSNAFLYDDKALVINNSLIRDVKNIPAFFSKDIWPAVGENRSNYFRPLIYIIFAINYYTAGLSAPLFHSVNIMFNAGCALMLFFIVRKLVKNKNALFLPFASAILFTTHPVHTEAVTWVSGLPDVSSTFFFLIAFYFFIKIEKNFKTAHFLSAFFFLTALLCKEPAIMLPAVLVIYDFSFFKKEGKNFFHYLKRYFPYVGVAGLYFSLRLNAVGGITPYAGHPALTGYEKFVNVFPLFTSYIKKLILPLNLNVFYVFHPIKSLIEFRGLISLLLISLIIIFLFLSRKKNALIFFAMLWIVITLLPSLYISALGENVFAERYLYLPSAGFALIIAFAINKIPPLRIGNKKTISSALIALLVITICYSVKTVQRNKVWINEMALWSDTVKKSPDGAIPHNNFAIVLRKADRTGEAIKHYKTAIKLRPEYFDAHYNLAIAYHLQQNLDKAEKEYKVALSLNPDSFSVHNNLGSLFRQKKLYDDAIKEYKKAIKLSPGFEMAKKNLKKTIILAGKPALARSLPD